MWATQERNNVNQENQNSQKIGQVMEDDDNGHYPQNFVDKLQIKERIFEPIKATLQKASDIIDNTLVFPKYIKTQQSVRNLLKFWTQMDIREVLESDLSRVYKHLYYIDVLPQRKKIRVLKNGQVVQVLPNGKTRKFNFSEPALRMRALDLSEVQKSPDDMETVFLKWIDETTVVRNGRKIPLEYVDEYLPKTMKDEDYKDPPKRDTLVPPKSMDEFFAESEVEWNSIIKQQTMDIVAKGSVPDLKYNFLKWARNECEDLVSFRIFADLKQLPKAMKKLYSFRQPETLCQQAQLYRDCIRSGRDMDLQVVARAEQDLNYDATTRLLGRAVYAKMLKFGVNSKDLDDIVELSVDTINKAALATLGCLDVKKSSIKKGTEVTFQIGRDGQLMTKISNPSLGELSQDEMEKVNQKIFPKIEKTTRYGPAKIPFAYGQIFNPKMTTSLFDLFIGPAAFDSEGQVQFARSIIGACNGIPPYLQSTIDIDTALQNQVTRGLSNMELQGSRVFGLTKPKKRRSIFGSKFFKTCKAIALAPVRLVHPTQQLSILERRGIQNVEVLEYQLMKRARFQQNDESGIWDSLIYSDLLQEEPGTSIAPYEEYKNWGKWKNKSQKSQNNQEKNEKSSQQKLQNQSSKQDEATEQEQSTQQAQSTQQD